MQNTRAGQPESGNQRFLHAQPFLFSDFHGLGQIPKFCSSIHIGLYILCRLDDRYPDALLSSYIKEDPMIMIPPEWMLLLRLQNVPKSGFRLDHQRL